MKKILIPSIFCVCGLLPLMMNAQKDSLPDPEFLNQIYQYDKVNKKLVELEKNNAEMKGKMKMIAGGMPVYSIEGSKSDARINSEKINSELTTFLISIASGPMMMDPSMTISLYKLESKKNKREAPIGYGGMGGRNDVKHFDLKFKKIKEGTYEIVVNSKLQKGEYGFINQNNMSASGKITIYAFGID